VKSEKPGVAIAIDMHMHACMIEHMRTTIEISDDTLRKLRELAARRGEKGYSRIIEEALGAYLASRLDESADERWSRLESLEGAWGAEEAERVRERIRETRKLWR
jgi:predicted transcriptional regulator